jgi:hypothetical protein
MRNLLCHTFALFIAAPFFSARADFSVDLFHFSSITSGGDFKGLGQVTVPEGVEGEHCVLTLTLAGRPVARWFGQKTSKSIRFEFTVSNAKLAHAALELSDRPLSGHGSCLRTCRATPSHC